MTQKDDIAALALRVKELEDRLTESGRRLLFAAEVKMEKTSTENDVRYSAVRADLDSLIETSSEVYERIASAGRSLLFASETPDKLSESRKE